MAIIEQTTLGRREGCTGVGLHSGVDATLTLNPAPPGSGIVFRRMDLGPHAGARASIAATSENVHDGTMCTVISNGAGTRVATVEHLMAALLGCGVDNALIEIDAPEVPIVDGSAAPFVALIERAGIVAQGSPRRAIRVLKRVEVRDGGRRARLAPAESLRVRFEIDFASPVVADQKCTFELSGDVFRREISRARTFGFFEQLDGLLARGLARGGSLDNAVVVHGDTILNEGGLRYEDEFVRHKVLDAMGDLYLAGAPMQAEFTGVQSGHRLTHRLIAKLLADASAWSYVELNNRARRRRGESDPLAATAAALA